MHKRYEVHTEVTDPDYCLTYEFLARMSAEGWVMSGCMIGRLPGSGETKAYAHYVFYREIIQ